jgi:hypothetical protein
MRHNLSLNLVGLIAPKFKKEIEQALIKVRYDTPRPFTLMLKDHFGNQPVSGCEIGYGYGDNAENLLQMLNIEKLYSVDPDFSGQGYVERGVVNKNFSRRDKDYQERIKRISPKTVFIEQTSDEAFSSGKIPSQLDFIYIDGNHDYDFCYRDIMNSLKFVRVGGFVGGHDFANPGYPKVADAVYDISLELKIRPAMVCPDFWFQKQA